MFLLNLHQNIVVQQQPKVHIFGLSSLVGQIVRGLPVRSISTLDEFCRESRPEVAILCIPKDAAVAIADQLVSLGIKGFWNFSHYDIALKYKDVSVENVHFVDTLMTLSYRLKNTD